MNNTEWKTIERFKGLYEFGSNGLVKCLPKQKNGFREIITRGSITSGKKKYYVLYVTNVDGTRRQEKVHRLIGEAHVPNPFNLPVVNHDDNNGLNNDKSNLLWTTDAGNKEHARINGYIPAGEKNANSKLSNIAIKEINASALPQKELAAKYGVTQRTISSIKRGRTWVQITKNKKLNISPRLSKEQILYIFNSQKDCSEIAKETRVHRSTVVEIKAGRLHSKHTGKEYEGDKKRHLTSSEILEIYNSKSKQSGIAIKYGISREHVNSIKTGFRHSKLTGAVYKKGDSLSDDIILQIFHSELSYSEISKKFNVSRKNISAIKTGYRHSDVTGKKFIKTRFFGTKEISK